MRKFRSRGAPEELLELIAQDSAAAGGQDSENSPGLIFNLKSFLISQNFQSFPMRCPGFCLFWAMKILIRTWSRPPLPLMRIRPPLNP